MAATDPAVALAHWRAVREWLFREHPQSPVPAAERADFRARHFDHDPRLRFVVPVEPAPAADPGALAARAAQQRFRLPLIPARRGRPAAVPGRRAAPLGLLAGRLRGRAVHPVPRRDERPRDVRRRSLPGRRGQVGRSRRGRVDRRPHPRLQLRDPAVVRLRPAMGLPAGSTREPPRRRGSRRRAADLGARPDTNQGTAASRTPGRALTKQRAPSMMRSLGVAISAAPTPRPATSTGRLRRPASMPRTIAR